MLWQLMLQDSSSNQLLHEWKPRLATAGFQRKPVHSKALVDAARQRNATTKETMTPHGRVPQLPAAPVGAATDAAETDAVAADGVRQQQQQPAAAWLLCELLLQDGHSSTLWKPAWRLVCWWLMRMMWCVA